PTKSGLIIARLYKQHLGIREAWIIHPRHLGDHIARGVRVCLFIDDFLGTGEQFTKMTISFGLAPLFKSVYAAYLPLAAHVQGIAYLRRKFSSLRVRAVEVFDRKHSVFNT